MCNLTEDVAKKSYEDGFTRGFLLGFEQCQKLFSNKYASLIKDNGIDGAAISEKELREKSYNKIAETKVVNGKKEVAGTTKKKEIKPLSYYPIYPPENIDKYMGIINALPSDAQINKSLLGISDKEWRRVREYLRKKNIVYCRNKATFKY